MRQDREHLPTSHGLVPAQGHRQPGTRRGINFPLSRRGGRAPWQCFLANISWLYLWVTLASHCSLLSQALSQLTGDRAGEFSCSSLFPC